MKYFSMKNIRGFTYTELIVTIIVLGVLASAAIPRFVFSREKTISAEAIQTLGTLREAQVLENFEKTSSTEIIDLLNQIQDQFQSQITRDYLRGKLDTISKTADENEKKKLYPRHQKKSRLG